MGQDKATLPIIEHGPPMIEMVLDRLRDVAQDVMIVANDQDRFAESGVRVVPDLEPGQGTLAGIQAAIDGAAFEHCLVVACDMPFLNQALLRAMTAVPRDYDVLAPYLPGTSKQGSSGMIYQTLHAIYSKRCLPAIEAQLRAGNRQVIGFFDDVRVKTISEAEARVHDPALRSFFNANTPENLELAARLMQGDGTGAR